MKAVRVSQSLAGGNLTFVGSFSMSEIGDPQAFCNERGLGLELRNKAGQAVGKHVPTVDFVSFSIINTGGRVNASAIIRQGRKARRVQ